MGILGFIKLFKNASMFLLKCQESIITFQLSLFLKRNQKHLKKHKNGCSITVEAEIKSKKEYLNNEIKTLLKQYKNNSDLILDYITNNKTKVFKLQNAKRILEALGEDIGLIPNHTGYKAFLLNLFLFKKIGFKTDVMFIIDNNDIDIYYLIQQFHRWYFMKNGFPGFDEKSQALLKKINKGNEDTSISKLTGDEITILQYAISRDIESISFVEQYARESAGSQKALNKIKSGEGACI